MRDIIFHFGGDIILIRINGINIFFANTAFGQQYSTIDGLRLSRQGVEKEFPDLKGKDNWREEAIRRFKSHIGKLSTETEIEEYVILELKKFGYIPKFRQIRGFRMEAL